MNIFDAGCGEGSHLGQIIHRLRSKGVSDLQGVGIDISKKEYGSLQRTILTLFGV